MPALDPVTQRFIADASQYLEEMSRLIEATELATAAVQELIDKIDELPAVKTVTIAVKTVGGAGDTGLGGMAAQAQAATQGVRDLAIAWTEEAVAQKAADAAAEAFGRDVARASAGFEAFMSDRLHASMENLNNDLYIQAHSAEQDAVGLARVAQAYREATTAIDPTVAMYDALRNTLQAADQQIAANEFEVRRLAQAFRDAPQTISRTADAAGRAGVGFRLFGVGMRVTGTALHWIAAGAAEFLAVAVPAAVALGAGMLVAMQGAQNAERHFTALYAATESTANAMHTTMGDVLGLGNALQTAQDAANPGVYELLGSAINDAKTRFSDFAGTGLQVVHMLDEFAARVTIDLKGSMGGQLHDLLDGMARDLQQFGQVFANLGRSILNFASAMPGLAHGLLSVLDGLSSLLEMASRAGPFLTFAMGMEELFRWGGLLVGVLARLTGSLATMNAIAGGGGFIIRFAAGIQALVGRAGLLVTALGGAIGEIGAFGAAGTRAGTALQGLGQEMTGLTYLAPAMVAGWLAAGAALVGIVLMLSKVKNATQQWVGSTNEAIAAAGQQGTVLNALGAAYAGVSTRLAQQEAILHSYPGYVQGIGSAFGDFVGVLNHVPGPLGNAAQGFMNLTTQTGLWGQVSRNVLGILPGGNILWQKFAGGAEQAASNVNLLRGEETGLLGVTRTVGANVGYLATQFHTTSGNALILANAAGVNLAAGLLKGTVAGKIAVQMVNNLKQGLGAMQAPATEIGADMEAVGVQSQLAASKVLQVNQGLDAFIATTTGGMNTIMQFNGQLRMMGHDGISSSVSLTGAINSISRSAAKMGFTLQGFGAHAQQSWQQFDAAVQTGNSVLDTFRIGMAEGVVSQHQYTNEIKAVGGALLPFAAHSRTALAIVSQLAQQMGVPATHNLKTLASEFGITGKAAQNMATGGFERAIARMANLNTIARNLSVTVGQQLDGAMAKAIVGASGLDNAYKKWALDLRGNKGTQTLQQDLNGIQKAQNFVNAAEVKGTKVLNDNGKAAGEAGSAYKAAAGSLKGLGGAAKDTHVNLMNQAVSAKTAMLNTQGLGQQAQTAAGHAQGLASQAGTATTQVKNLGTASHVTQGYLGNVNNEIRTAATAAGNAQGPLGSMTGQIRNVGSAAQSAAGQVSALATAMAGLQSKTVTLTTNMVTVTSTVHRQHGGPVWPGQPFTVGEAGRELFVPSVPGFIVPHDQTERILSPVASPETAAAANVVHLSASLPVTVSLDGQTVWQNMQQRTLVYGIRNGTPQQGRMAPASPYS